MNFQSTKSSWSKAARLYARRTVLVASGVGLVASTAASANYSAIADNTTAATEVPVATAEQPYKEDVRPADSLAEVRQNAVVAVSNWTGFNKEKSGLEEQSKKAALNTDDAKALKAATVNERQSRNQMKKDLFAYGQKLARVKIDGIQVGQLEIDALTQWKTRFDDRQAKLARTDGKDSTTYDVSSSASTKKLARAYVRAAALNQDVSLTQFPEVQAILEKESSYKKVDAVPANVGDFIVPKVSLAKVDCTIQGVPQADGSTVPYPIFVGYWNVSGGVYTDRGGVTDSASTLVNKTNQVWTDLNGLPGFLDAKTGKVSGVVSPQHYISKYGDTDTPQRESYFTGNRDKLNVNVTMTCPNITVANVGKKTTKNF